MRRPCTFPAAAAGFGERLAHRPPTVSVGDGHQRVGRGGVIGEAAGAQHDLGPHPLGDPAFQRRPAGCGGQVPAGSPATGALDPPVREVPGVEDRPPPGAAAQVGEQRPADRPVVGPCGP